MDIPIIIYTDGACKGNPGHGGWAAVLSWNGREREISGHEADTTNNRMEMTAIIRALQALKKTATVHIYTDSKYVSQGVQQWLPQWRRKGFRKADGKPVKNPDLWQEIDRLTAIHSVQWFWVRGHDGCPGNEQADKLAHQAALQGKQAQGE